MTDLATRAILPSDLEGLAELTHSALGTKRSKAFYRWKYFDNPVGHVLGRCACQDERLLGSHGAIPLMLQAGEQSFRTIQLVDAMVVPSARRSGIFSQLANENYEWIDNERIIAGFVFPAPVTLKAITSKFDWTHVLDIPRFVRVLDMSKALNAVGNPVRQALYALSLAAINLTARSRSKRPKSPAVQIKEIDSYDARFDDLWARVSKEIKLAVARTSTYLKWRFGAHPERTYRCLGASTSGKLDAYAILSQTQIRGADTWEIVDLIVDPVMTDVGLTLLHNVCSQAQDQGIAQLTIWMSPHQTRYVDLLSATGFVHAQSRFLPRRFRYSTPLVSRSHPQLSLPLSPYRAENWFITMGDSDLH